ncbi:MAG: helicase-related protein [Bacteroidetes bacterium]|nr:helicase-related protein [Bacteroidota bacterium]
MWSQFAAISTSDAILQWARSDEDLERLACLEGLGYFEVSCPVSLKASESDPILSVAENIITRGVPTKASIRTEEALVEKLGLTRRDDGHLASRLGQIRYIPSAGWNDILPYLDRALIPIDPRVVASEEAIDAPAWESGYDSEAEKQFHIYTLPSVFGPHAFQTVELQRPLKSILSLSQGRGGKGLDKETFVSQKVDFVSAAVPEASNARRTSRIAKSRFILEVDGTQHKEQNQLKQDKDRDKAASAAGWSTIRISTQDLKSDTFRLSGAAASTLSDWEQSELVQLAKENFSSPLWGNVDSRKALELVMIPIAVSRMQLVLLRLIRSGSLSLSDTCWKIAVLERDVPFARLAIADFKDLLENLYGLAERNIQLPEIELQVCNLLNGDQPEFSPADVLLDLSTLLRRGYTFQEDAQGEFRISVQIRNAHRKRKEFSVMCAAFIQYKIYDGTRDCLLHFLRNLFRKEGFREGQESIVRLALNGSDAVALLPTGAGKSLTYQLSALLQPGVTVVIDPIKSLMKDQVEGLVENGMTKSAFINSSLNTEERRSVQRGLKNGSFQFVFVSPERFVIDEFRAFLREMNSVWFAYAVVDEAHCVSEWGHDFRPSYLQLGRNLRQFLPTSPKARLPVLALTGTASFDVLEDVQRELEIREPESVITPDSYARDELVFSVEKVDCSDINPGPDSFNLKAEIAERKMAALELSLVKLAERFDFESVDELTRERGSDTHSGLVFTPHKNWKLGVNGVESDLHKRLSVLVGRTRRYAGTDEEKGFTEAGLEIAQNDFKSNKCSLLIATKAFGMGIDKPNVRYTIHFNMPQSIESFYQEAGRAGRDRQKAHCIVLHSTDKLVAHPESQGGYTSMDKELMLFFHRGAFPGQEKELAVLDSVLKEAAKDDKNEWYGLEEVLNTTDPHQNRTIPVFFDNDAARRISDLVTRAIGKNVAIGLIRSSSSFAFTHSDFALNVEEDLRKKNWPINFNALQNALRSSSVERDFLAIREDKSTHKAVYRLVIVGALEDYTIDYGRKLINTRMSSQGEESYIPSLQKYLSRYLPPEEVRQVPEAVLSRSESTILRQCLGHLIDFVYQRIASKRLEAIINMEDALIDGIPREGESFEAARGRLSERVYSYFESRYIPELRSESGRASEPEVAYEFFEKTNGVSSEFKHLRGASARLLESNPDHIGYLLIRSFSELILGESTPVSGAVNRDFSRAMEIYRRAGKSQLEVVGEVNRFVEWASKVGGERARLSGEAFHLLIHNNWLQNFRAKHLPSAK